MTSQTTSPALSPTASNPTASPATSPVSGPASGPATATVRAIWTDFGGVLTAPIGQTLTDFCARTNVEPEPLVRAMMKVASSYGTDDIMLPIDTPLVSEPEWTAQIAAVLAEDHQMRLGVSTLADVWFGDRPANEAWIQRLRRARADGLFVGMLSNMVPAWDEHWRRMVDPAALFDAVVLSFEVGHRKPGREIFDLAAERAGVAPAECLFVDDLAKNCDGAVAAGWQAIHFTDTAVAVAELDRLLQPAR
jgi:putative hydrolase of the HAD superfamily